ncbi:MAG: polysaccharide biosynthesis tyrosine autokinase [Actinobacteria bacterium]|nr:polysaccharide biosynthesis tyrosine autokinase [Actinomycetota bacterium]
MPAVAQLALRGAGLKDRTPDELLESSAVTNPPDSDILRFSVTDRGPNMATRLATEYAKAFTDYRRKMDTGSLIEARKQIEKRLAALEKARQTKSGLYRVLAKNDQQVRTFAALQGSNTSLLRPGNKAVQTQPKELKNTLLGLLLGLVMGVGLAFVREALNTRVRSSEEVEERFDLPLLARIPEPGKRSSGDHRIAMLQGSHGNESEAFRMLVTNLRLANLQRGAQSIMVTSALREEGKSTTLANIAVAFARGGSRVALVDLDLKRPSINEFFKLPPDQPGLTNVVLGRATLEEALFPVALEEAGASGGNAASVGVATGRLEVLGTGPLPPHSADFVASPQVSQLIADLAERNDLVLIDTPPLLQVSDAMALTAKIDAVIVLARLLTIRRPALRELRRLLDAAPVAKLGLVVTGAEREEGYGYGGYGYGGYGRTRSQTTDEHVAGSPR